jgi:DNA-directed RNA polymerase subunit RPC12/RpoP
MASWQLACVNCKRNFTQSLIDETSLANFYLALKPVFPVKGSEFECPHCGYKATYQRFELLYKA